MPKLTKHRTQRGFQAIYDLTSIKHKSVNGSTYNLSLLTKVIRAIMLTYSVTALILRINRNEFFTWWYKSNLVMVIHPASYHLVEFILVFWLRVFDEKFKCLNTKRLPVYIDQIGVTV